MSGWMSGWFKNKDEAGTENSAGSGGDAPTSASTSAPTTAPPAETAAEIREKRLRKLEATSAAAAAAAAATAVAPTGPVTTAPPTLVPPTSASASSSSSNLSSSTSTSSLTTVKPVSRPTSAQPIATGKSGSTLSAAAPSSATATTPSPRSTPLSSSPGIMPPISPQRSTSVTSSLAAVSLKTGIHPITQAMYSSIRSALPASLVLTYSGAIFTPEELHQNWEHLALSEIFAVRVTQDKTAASVSRTFLPGLSQELASTATEKNIDKDMDFLSKPLLIDREHLDSLVMERLTQFQSEPASSASSDSHSSSGGDRLTSFTWMIAAYRRVIAIEEKVRTGLESATAASTPAGSIYPAAASEWNACLESITVARTCIVRYIGLLISDEDLFQTRKQRDSARQDCMKLLCSDANVSRTLPVGLWDALVTSYTADPESLDDTFKYFATALATPTKFAPTKSQLGEIQPTMEDACKQLVGLAQMFRFAPTGKLIVQSPSWIPKAPSGRLFMTVTTLGPLFSLSTTSTEPAFQQVVNRVPMQEIESEILRLRTSYTSYQGLCVAVCRNGIKHPIVREGLLQWFAGLIQANTARRRMQYHPFEVSSDALFYNSMIVTLRLAAPVIKKAGREDFQKVNLTYLLQTTGAGRIEYDNITRIQSTLADVKAMRAALPKSISFTPNEAPYSPFNFVTEIFFLTHEILYEGLGSILRQYTELMQQIGRDSRQLQAMDPNAIMYGQLQAQLDHLFSINLATRVHLQDPIFVNEVIAFYDWTAKWIRFAQAENDALHANDSAAATTTPATAASASASSRAPSYYGLIPEPIIETMIDFFIYLARFQPTHFNSLPSTSYSGILDLVLSLCAGTYALKNPHLRASLAEFLMMLLPLPNDFSNPAEHVFVTDPNMQARLVPALLELYVNVEDGRGMYYQKFSARNQINMILEFLWAQPIHKAKLIEIAHATGLTHVPATTAVTAATSSTVASSSSSSSSVNVSPQLFVKFINVLANDLIFLLDEGLKQLNTIREVQLEMENEEKWQSQAPDVLRERERAYGQSEQGATSCLTLANATVHMLFYLTTEIITPFVAPEFVERMAHMLDYYIMQLCGPKISELKVKNRERYAFKPRDLLQEIIGIWLHLAHDKEFLNKVAADERSYRPSLWAKAARIMRHRAIMPERTIARFEQLNSELEQLGESLVALDEILGDLPDEYADGLMGTLMVDPVQLPQSKQFVDRATIHRQLMNKKVDPFSNTPLTEDMLIEKPELKAEIEKWIEERKKIWREAKKKEAAEAAATVGGEDEKEETSTTPTHLSSSAASAASSSTSVASSAPSSRKTYLDE